MDVFMHESTVVWAVGKSRYYLPSGSRSRSGVKAIAQMNHLGAGAGPDVFYAVIPWAWLSDYFHSFGWVFSALANGMADSVIFDYAYVMRKKMTVHKRVASHVVRTTKGVNSSDPMNPMRVYATREKSSVLQSRHPASLFGFGLSEGDLSLRQLGILGALGLSKM